MITLVINAIIPDMLIYDMATVLTVIFIFEVMTKIRKR